MIKQTLVLLSLLVSVNLWATTNIRLSGTKGEFLDDVTRQLIIYHSDEEFAQIIEELFYEGLDVEINFNKGSAAVNSNPSGYRGGENLDPEPDRGRKPSGNSGSKHCSVRIVTERDVKGGGNVSVRVVNGGIGGRASERKEIEISGPCDEVKEILRIIREK